MEVRKSAAPLPLMKINLLLTRSLPHAPILSCVCQGSRVLFSLSPPSTPLTPPETLSQLCATETTGRLAVACVEAFSHGRRERRLAVRTRVLWLAVLRGVWLAAVADVAPELVSPMRLASFSKLHFLHFSKIANDRWRQCAYSRSCA